MPRGYGGRGRVLPPGRHPALRAALDGRRARGRLSRERGALRAALVLNERSGTLSARPELVEAIPAALAEAGFVVEAFGGGFAERLEAALASDAPLVVVGGGDGTIRAAAERLMGTGRALGVLPLGTLNLLARDLGLPEDPLEAARALGRAATREIDVGTVNGAAFLCQSVLGLPNAIGRLRERHRRERSWRSLLRLVVGALRTLARGRPLRLTVSSPDWRRPWRGRCRALTVVTGRYDEEPGAMFRRAALDSGVLVLHASRAFSLGWMARMLAAMALGRWKRDPTLVIREAPALLVEAERPALRVMNDGEACVLRAPLAYALHPRALRVLAASPGP